MAVQNAIYLPNRVSKKKHYYDPLLEKGILNTVTALGKDSSMDDEDYQQICFCPSNNKLYAVRVNSSTNVGNVDVICPNSTTETQSPDATVSVGNYAKGIVYCPSVDRIFVVSRSNVLSSTSTASGAAYCQIINPRTNVVENEIQLAASPDGTNFYPEDAVYHPMVDRIYVGSLSRYISAIDPGKFLGLQYKEAKEEIKLDTGVSNASASKNLVVNPQTNRLNFLSIPAGVDTNSPIANKIYSAKITVNKKNQISYSFGTDPFYYAGVGYHSFDMIVCPFNDLIYVLHSYSYTSSSDMKWRIWVFDDLLGSNWYIHTYRPTDIAVADPSHDQMTKKLVYCPDNNMIYVLGLTQIHMINPIHAGRNDLDTTPEPGEYKDSGVIGRFYDSNINIPINDACYSPVNQKIYGVGDDGDIKYINPTT